MPQTGMNSYILLEQHRRDLEKSGLTPETIAACCFHSLTDSPAIRSILRWQTKLEGVQRLGPCLAIPFVDLAGKQIQDYVRLKPDRPRLQKSGDKSDKPVKYESPKGLSNRAYFPPMALPAIRDPSAQLFITEGEKKAVAATQAGFPCIGLVGIWGWQKKRESIDGRKVGSRELIADLTAIDWCRPVYIVFDSDAVSNPNIRFAEIELIKVLRKLGADVRVLRLPQGPPGADGRPAKVGIDDFLVAHGRDAFAELLETAKEIPDQRCALDINSSEKTAPTRIRGVAYKHIQRATATAPFCSRHAVPLLESVASDQDVAILRVGCRRLDCPACVPHRRKAWIEHLENLLNLHSGSLYLWRGDNGRQAKLTKAKARKCRAEFAWVATEAETILVATVSIAGSTLLSGDDALETLAQATLCWRPGRRPIGTSKAWQIAERKRKRRRWLRRGEAPRGQFRDTIHMVESAGLSTEIRESVRGDAFASVELPAGFAGEFFFAITEGLPLRPTRMGASLNVTPR